MAHRVATLILLGNKERTQTGVSHRLPILLIDKHTYLKVGVAALIQLQYVIRGL